VSVLRPAEQLFDDMLAGWAGQQSSRLLSSKTIGTREAQVRRFTGFCAASPWEWAASDVEEWTTELLSGPRPLTPSTIRSYQNAVALFCSYLTDARYGWIDRCMELFGTHPVQVCHEWNTVIHVADHEARPAVRPLTRVEVQALFDHADDHVDFARTSKRKGWLTLYRDATLFKVIYAYGLAVVKRRCSISMTSPETPKRWSSVATACATSDGARRVAAPSLADGPC
jgi:integrase/recombinase XerC